MRLAAGIAWLLLPTAALAGERTVDVNLSAGTLGHALASLSRQADIDVGADDPGLQKMRTRTVRGRMDVATALALLLRGTGAISFRDRHGIWRVVRRAPPPRRPARPMPPTSPPPPPPPPPAEIVVTASRRATALGDYPGTAIIIGKGELERSGSVQRSDAIVARAAGLGSTHFGSGRDKLFIRGIIDSGFGGTGQATTAQYVDGARVNYNGPDPDLRLYDIERVEILSGPQATLYGAGALGGVVHILSRRPDPGISEGHVAVGLSATRHGAVGGDAAATINAPLLKDRIAVRLVGFFERRGGYIDNPLLGVSDANDAATYGARAALRGEFGDWVADAGTIWQSTRAGDSDWTDGGAQRLTRSSAVREPYGSDYVQASLSAERAIGDLTLSSTSAIVRHRATQRYDTGNAAPPHLVTERDRYDMEVSETRLSRAGAYGAGWVVGVHLLDSRSKMGRFNDAQTVTDLPRQSSDNRIREATLYGEAGVAVSDRLVVTGGLRLSAIRQQGEAWASLDLTALPPGGGKPRVVTFAQNDLRAVPSLALAFRPGGAWLLFARYQQGFRPRGAGIAGPEVLVHAGDRLHALETGARWSPAGAGIELALSASYSRWDDILAEIVSTSGDLMTANIGDGEIGAVEARFNWHPGPGWTLDAGIFFNKSRLTRSRLGTVALQGEALPNVPRIGLRAGLEGGWSVRGATRFDWTLNLRYFGRSRIGSGPALDTGQGDYLDTGLGLRLGDAHRALRLDVENLFDSAADRFALGTPYRIYDRQMTPQPPRSIRIGFEAKF